MIRPDYTVEELFTPEEIELCADFLTEIDDREVEQVVGLCAGVFHDE